ncbi:hypothetical protein DSO57_1022804 [Entomophthora muscae]|uniref:Uncharacterized protein n=1 Tax=Entomophthora muscae TaxID=34485 RepID=A0ACC2TDV4_9FUNG|nr:hypothetical protein DSO57_1022804 [Entomophthora muscae]
MRHGMLNVIYRRPCSKPIFLPIRSAQALSFHLMENSSVRRAEPSFIAKAAEYVSDSATGLLLDIGWTPFINTMRNEIFKMFKNIKLGELLIELPDGSEHHFGNRNDPLSAKLSVKSERLWIRLVLYKDLGLAEGYLAD